MLHRAYNICNTWDAFHVEIQIISQLLRKNLFPPSVIDQHIKNFLNTKLEKTSKKSEQQQQKVGYYKLPFIGKFSISTKDKISKLCEQYCKTLKIKLVLTPTKLMDFFNTKDSLPKDLRSYVVYKFRCASCNACYIGETKRHFKTRVNEHLHTDKESKVFQHLKEHTSCNNACGPNCFEIIDFASSSFRLKIKEAIHIGWEKPSLNTQVKHVSINLSI